MSKNHLPPIVRRWRLFAAAMAVTALGGGGVLLAASSDPSTALAFHSITSTRVLDTRPSTQVGSRSTPLGRNETFVVPLAELPDDATAVTINVTVVDGTEGSFLTVYSTGDARPNTSAINWDSANALANSSTVNIQANHSLSLYNLKGTVNVIIDLLGYYSPLPAGTGAQGPKGDPGAPGPKGDTGLQGPKGDSGSGGVYLYAVNTVPETAAIDGVVEFDSVVKNSTGFVEVPNLLDPNDLKAVGFGVPSAGTYKVTFGVVAFDAGQLSVQVDGTDPAVPLVFGAPGAASQQTSSLNGGTAVIDVPANGIISLANATTGADIDLLTPTGGPGPSVSAWILIEKIG